MNNYNSYEQIFFKLGISTKLLYKIVNDAKKYKADMDDYVIECIVFIIDGMKKYDKKKGTKKDTYAFRAKYFFNFNWMSYQKKNKMLLFADFQKNDSNVIVNCYYDEENSDGLFEQARELIQKEYGKLGEQIFSFLCGEVNIFDEIAEMRGHKATKKFISSLIPTYYKIEKQVKNTVKEFCVNKKIIKE